MLYCGSQKEKTDNTAKSLAAQVQQKASDPSHSVYISASAGTGKTKVLVDRMLRLFLTGVNPINVLCITFTNAAADELMHRLKKKLESWIFISDENLELEIIALTGLKDKVSSQDLSAARGIYGIFLDNLENIKIETLHAFCSKILSLGAVALNNVNIQMNLIDSFEKNRLMQQAYFNVFKLAEKDNILSSSISKLALFKDHNTILNDALSSMNNIDEFSTILENEKFDIFKFFHSHAALEYRALYESKVLEVINSGNLSSEVLDVFAGVAKNKTDLNTLRVIQKWSQSSYKERLLCFDEYVNTFLTANKMPRKKLLSKEIMESKPYIIDSLLKEQQLIYQVVQSLENHKVAEISHAMQIFIYALKKEFEALKAAHGYIEYNNLLTQAFLLLSESEDRQFLLYKLDSVIDHVLVDEAQDLSKTQWDIIKLLTEDFFSGLSTKYTNRSVFIVGDFKQSIFGFQGAAPSIFHEIKAFYRKKARDAKKKWVELEMNVSFRSSIKVLELVDNIFNDQAYKKALGSDNDGLISHIPFRKIDGFVARLPLLKLEKDLKRSDGAWELPVCNDEYFDKDLNAAKAIASHVLWIISRDNVKIKPSDIMILMRKRSALEDFLISELKRYGILSHNIGIKAKDHLVIQDLISLAKFLALPTDDLNLACLLKSPFFGISEEQLFYLAYDRGDVTLLDSIKKKDSGLASDLQFLVELFCEFSIYNFYHQILYKCQKIKSFIARLGYNALSIIEKFLDNILEYEKNYKWYGIEYFVHWMNEIYENISISDSGGYSDNAVRIMTIHSAKGLQAKVVILADSAYSENLPHDSLLCYKSHVIYGLSESYSNIADALKLQNKYKRYDENLRLLYVALTRAEDELYIFGVENKNLNNSWYSILQNYIPEFHDESRFDVLQSYQEEHIGNLNTVTDIEKMLSNHNNIKPHYLKSFYNKECDELNISSIQNSNALKSSLSQHAKVVEKKSEESIVGILIHHVLCNLCRIKRAKWELYIKQYLENNEDFDLLSSISKEGIIPMINNTIQNFEYVLIAPNAFSEIGLSGLVDDLRLVVRVDKIIIINDTIEIIEFKTGVITCINDIKQEYYNQLYIYKTLINQYFIKYKIKIKILALYSQQAFEINIFDNSCK